MNACAACADPVSMMYHVGCDRCEARAWARALQDGGNHTAMYVARLPPAMRALIDEERARIDTSEAA